jgi:hypothetical protein
MRIYYIILFVIIAILPIFYQKKQAETSVFSKNKSNPVEPNGTDPG